MDPTVADDGTVKAIVPVKQAPAQTPCVKGGFPSPTEMVKPVFVAGAVFSLSTTKICQVPVCRLVLHTVPAPQVQELDAGKVRGPGTRPQLDNENAPVMLRTTPFKL